MKGILVIDQEKLNRLSRCKDSSSFPWELAYGDDTKFVCRTDDFEKIWHTISGMRIEASLQILLSDTEDERTWLLLKDDTIMKKAYDTISEAHADEVIKQINVFYTDGYEEAIRNMIKIFKKALKQAILHHLQVLIVLE